MSKHYTFEIDAPGDWGGGIPDCQDTVTITVASGDPGGDAESEEFIDHIIESLQLWYDTPSVVLVKVEVEDYEILYDLYKDAGVL